MSELSTAHESTTQEETNEHTYPQNEISTLPLRGGKLHTVKNVNKSKKGKNAGAVHQWEEFSST